MKPHWRLHWKASTTVSTRPWELTEGISETEGFDETEGIEEGNSDKNKLGRRDGPVVGSNEGCADGTNDAKKVGFDDGIDVGITLGTLLKPWVGM